MMHATDYRNRMGLALFGGLAMYALWALGQAWSDPALPPRLVLAAFAFSLSYGALVLVLSGPVPLRRALAGALAVALPLTALVSWAGARYIRAEALLDQPSTVAVAVVMTTICAPFLLVRMQAPAAWLSYAALFTAAWTIVVRFIVAWLFVGLFWAVLYLSNAMLRLVNVEVIEFILRRAWLGFALTGAMLGLAMAVVYELRATISPDILLRLLRLFVPFVLGVILLFLAALVVSDISDLFGEFSAAGTLMGMAVAALTLVCAALGADESEAVTGRAMRVAARALVLVIPLVAALALWAVALRVRQYGWTPDRVMAALIAAVLLSYGLFYALAASRKGDWAARIRRANVGLALGVVGLCALWMTPLLNAPRLATASQVARFTAGQITLEQLPVWALARDWGKAGQAGLDRLLALQSHPDQVELTLRIAEARAASSEYQYLEAVAARGRPERDARLAGLLAIRPGEGRASAAMFAQLEPYELDRWLAGCDRTLPDNRPGCVLIHGAFVPGIAPQDQGILLFLAPEDDVQAAFLTLRNGVVVNVGPVFNPVANGWTRLSAGLLVQALDGAFEIRPSGANALWIGGTALMRAN